MQRQRAMGGFQEERDTACCCSHSEGCGLAPPLLRGPSGKIGYIAVLSPGEEKAAVDQEKRMALGSGRGAWAVLSGPTPSPSPCSPPPL